MNYFFTFSLYSIGILSLFVENSTRLNFNLLFYFWIFQFLRFGFFREIKNQNLIFYIILIMLYLIPSLAIRYYYAKDLTNILFLLIIFMDILKIFSTKYFNKKIYYKSSYVNNVLGYLIYFLLISWSSIGPFLIPQSNSILGMLSFMFPHAIALIYLEKIIQNSKSTLDSTLVLMLHFIFMSIYFNNHWSGHGRIVLGFFILAPILIYMITNKISFRPWVVLTITPLALFILQFSRFNDSLNLETLFLSSAGYHLVLTELVSTKDFFFDGQGFQAFIDQYMLLFLSWFPREFWELKPEGIGHWSVDVMFDRSTILSGEAYSQSMGFIGEQILMLGDYYIFGLIIVLISIIILRKIVIYFSYGSNVPALIFDLNLMSYFWGGMALFGSRVWFILIPVLVFNYIRHSILNNYLAGYQYKKILKKKV